MSEYWWGSIVGTGAASWSPGTAKNRVPDGLARASRQVAEEDVR